MYDWARVGAKVVCVNTWVNRYNPDTPYGYENLVGPYEGQVLTIRTVEIHPNDNQLTIRFEEINNPPCPFMISGVPTLWEHSFNVKNYRPLTTKRVELPASLTSLLSSPKKKIRADIFDKGKIFDPV